MRSRRGAVIVAIGITMACGSHPSSSSRSRGLPAPRDSIGVVNVVELERFVDSVITGELRRSRAPGAAFAYVQQGRIVLLKGYGEADVSRRAPVSGESTIWRIGSISKVITATAVRQLADRGHIDLHANVNRYLTSLKVRDTLGSVVTAEQLLDHTAGFDEVRPGTQAGTEAGVLPLAEFLSGTLRRVRPAGETISYSTYGITLAGLLVEDVSHQSFETYLQRNVFGPLGMSRSFITVPPALRLDVAMGYELARDSSLVPQPWEWYHTTPASSINATAADMARFMMAHLDSLSAGRARVMSESAWRDMHRQHVTMHPQQPGYALGFYEDYVGGLRVIEHGGNMAGFSSQMTLIPDEGAGFFVVSHFEQSQLRDNLREALLRRFFPRARSRLPVPTASPNSARHLARFAGRYGPTSSCHTCQPRSVPYIITVTANADGTLGITGRRWVEEVPMVFVREDGTGRIVFRADSTGRITLLSAGGFWTFERLP